MIKHPRPAFRRPARLFRALLLLLACSITSAGCAARVFVGKANKDLLQHAIFIGADGTPALIYDAHGHSLNTSDLIDSTERNAKHVRIQRPVLPRDTSTYIGKLDRYRDLNYDYEEYVARIVDGLKKSGRKHVLIFIPGGRNTLAGALDSSTDILKQIEKDTKDLVYTIFIDYESGDLSSYVEHLRNPRPERRNVLEQSYTMLRPPTRLVADIGAGAARVPLTLYQEIAREYQTVGSDARTTVPQTFVLDNLRVTYGGYEESGLKRTMTLTSGLLTAPLRMGFGLLIATAAPGEWESMRRRSEFALRPPDEFSRGQWNDYYSPASGAVGILLDRLSPAIDTTTTVTLIGHSTGTILACETLRLHPEWKFDDIVFMAAACTVREFESAVLPYLRTRPTTHFYNLCLHPVAELRETFMPVIGSMVYHGSLLTWIDDYLDTPLGPVDRTMGRAENCLAAQHEWPRDVRRQIAIRVMDYHPARRGGASRDEFRIERHSDFSNMRARFWNVSFWWPDSTTGSVPELATAAAPSKKPSHPKR